LNRIASATSVEQRSGIVKQELEKGYVALAQRLAPGDVNLAEAMREAFRAPGRENAIIKQYTPEKLAKGELPSLDGVLLNGQTTTHTFAGDQAIFEYQFLDDVISLPDNKEISKLISKYNNNKVKYGAKQSLV
jgi:hypothetical protein